LHGEKFLAMMAGCRAVVCTAGFESVSEAAYLGKPVLMIPVQNHIEQFLNALDAVNAGLGLRDTDFHLSRLLAPELPSGGQKFRDWVDSAERIAMEAVERVVSAGV
jgi:predicted glycosyltransferase